MKMKIENVQIDMIDNTISLRFEHRTNLVKALNIINEAIRNESDAGLDLALAEVLRSEGTIQAIKLYRERTGFGLKDSKDYVCALRDRLGIPSPAGRY